MGKITKYRLAGICLGVLFLGILILFASLQEDDKLQATLSDGTIIKIEKVEVTKTPSYGSRNLLHKIEAWFCDQRWVQDVCKTLKIESDGGLRAFETGESCDNETFCIWFSLSDPRQGFFPETVNSIVHLRKKEGVIGTSFNGDVAGLIDDDGCKYSKGRLYLDSQKLGPRAKIVYVLMFESFNNVSEKYQLAIEFPEKKEPVVFTLKNPKREKISLASHLATPLPAKQPLGNVSIILRQLSRRESWGRAEWSPIFHFERNGVIADKDYMVVTSEVGDPQGGRSNNVCAKANEWIVTGFARTERMELIDTEKRIQLENLSQPRPSGYLSVNIPGDMQKVIAKAYLVGAGTYVLDADNVISAGGLDDLKKQGAIFNDIRYPSNYKSTSETQSGVSWEDADKESFLWKQRIFDRTTQHLLLLTDRPTLLLRLSPAVTEHSALFISNPALKWNFREVNFSNNPWRVVPLDWKEADGPQTLEIGYAEAMSFELHILPTEEMRQSLVLPSEKKVKR